MREMDGEIGRHCILDADGCCAETLNDPVRIEAAVRRAVREATLESLAVKVFEPQGVTALALLAESHLSLHTWPELAYAAIDAFTCGPVDPQDMCECLAEALGASRSRVHVIPRGPAEASGALHLRASAAQVVVARSPRAGAGGRRGGICG